MDTALYIAITFAFLTLLLFFICMWMIRRNRKAADKNTPKS